MKLGILARLVALAALTGCITSGEARDEEYAVFRSRSGGYLRVSLDRNEYESNAEPPTKTRRGSLRDEDWQQVQALTSDDKMAAYAETDAEDRAACIDDPNAYALSTRTSLGGCWVPSEVTDEQTTEMLDFFVPLLAANVPSRD
jgi:hypothetical protein